MREITIIPSDESIKELWEIRVKFRLNELEALEKGEKEMTYDRYYAMMKKPFKAYCI